MGPTLSVFPQKAQWPHIYHKADAWDCCNPSKNPGDSNSVSMVSMICGRLKCSNKATWNIGRAPLCTIHVILQLGEDFFGGWGFWVNGNGMEDLVGMADASGKLT